MHQWRAFAICIFLFVFAAALIGRLAFLQIVRHGFYKALAQGQQSSDLLAHGERGDIVVGDRKGNWYTVATNQKIPLVFAVPTQIPNKEDTAIKLSTILALDKEVLLEKFSHTESLYQVLKRKLSPEETQLIEMTQLPGIFVKNEELRTYPQETFASRILGFTNQERKGQYGVEEYYEKELAGKEGIRKDARNVASYLAASKLEDTLEDGADVVLTIDYNIQSMAEALLERAKKTLNIEEGSIVVMDPATGKLLALASFPNFNPNEYGKTQNLATFQNPAVESLFEPGSVFKPLTMAAAIDTNALTPASTYEDKGILRIGGYKILNYDNRTWGTRTMTQVLEFSINTGAVFAEQQVGHEQFLKYLERFGVFQPTNIDLPGEVYSQNRELRKKYEITFATASFGQGIEMTAMQLLRAYTALANGGKMAKPFLVQKVTQAGTATAHAPELSQPVISPETAAAITQMLVNVIENGFSKKAKLPGYYIAGKTGTAQVSWSALGVAKPGYSDKTVQSFIGYAPAFTPKFLILVKLDNPAAKTAEYSAMPLFKDLAKYIIDYYQIPPDYEE